MAGHFLAYELHEGRLDQGRLDGKQLAVHLAGPVAGAFGGSWGGRGLRRGGWRHACPVARSIPHPGFVQGALKMRQRRP